MCAWRALAVLQRVACVVACHLSPHHATRFCRASAGYACPSMRKHKDLCNSKLGTNLSLHLRSQRKCFKRSIFLFLLAKIADDRQQTTRGEHNATTLPHSSSRRQHYLCTWRVLAMLQRVACVGVYRLSPHHATRFCCAAAGCACPWMRKHRELCNSNLNTKSSLH